MQAVSRKAEGIEPRNCSGWEGRRHRACTEVNMKGGNGALVAPRPVRVASPGSVTMACMERLCGNPGDPMASFMDGRGFQQPKEGRRS